MATHIMRHTTRPTAVAILILQLLQMPLRLQVLLAADASYSELFFFDEHCALSALYCQEIKYSFTTAILALWDQFAHNRKKTVGNHMLPTSLCSSLVLAVLVRTTAPTRSPSAVF